MAFPARLYGGPRDGEELVLVEDRPVINVICEPPGDKPEGFHTHRYEKGQRDPREGGGPIPYKYIGPAVKDTP